MKMHFKWTLITSIILGFVGGNSLAEPLYVQAAKGALREKPELTAPILQELPRGTAFESIATEGAWYRVKIGVKTGFIHRLFVGKQKPLETDALQKLGEDQDLAKSVRRRSSSYSVAATTRGLTAGNRVREGRDRYPSDPEALQKIESRQIHPDSLRKFQLEGGLR